MHFICMVKRIRITFSELYCLNLPLISCTLQSLIPNLPVLLALLNNIFKFLLFESPFNFLHTAVSNPSLPVLLALLNNIFKILLFESPFNFLHTAVSNPNLPVLLALLKTLPIFVFYSL